MKLPAFWSALLFISGIWIGRAMPVPEIFLFIFSILFFVAGLIIHLKGSINLAWMIAAAALFVAGVFRIGLEISSPSPNDVGIFNDLGKRVTLKGEIIREPDIRSDKTLLTLRADTIIEGDKKMAVSGRALVRLKYMSSNFSYADYISAHGFLSSPMPARNPGAFDYRQYLANKKIGSILYVSKSHDIIVTEKESGNLFLSKIIIPLRKHILHTFDKYIGSPQKSLIAGFLIGETRFIPSEIHTDFRDSGTLHLLAVSGSNVALVIGTVELILILLWVPSRQRHIISLLVIILFCYLSYNQPSVVRASVMISLYLLGRLAYRKVNYINILSMAAILILIFEPLMLWDVGFQLSFAATFGLVYFLPIIYSKLFPSGSLRKKLPNFLLMTFLSSLVAQLSVAPILAVNFNSIPVIGLIANLLIVPLAGITVVLSLFLVMLGWFHPLGYFLGKVSDQLLIFAIKSVDFFAELPLAKIEMPSPEWYLVGLYYLMLYLAFRLLKDMVSLKYLLFSVLVFVNVMIWRANIYSFSHNPSIIVLDLGSHVAIHVKCCDGSDYLIKAACSSDFSDSFEARTIRSYLINEGISRIKEITGKIGTASQTGESRKDGLLKSERISLIMPDDGDELLGAAVSHLNRDVVILLTQNRLDLLKSLEFEPDILIIPEPAYITESIMKSIRSIDVRILIFSSYQSLYWLPPGYEQITNHITGKNIDFYNVRDCGAVRIMLNPTGIRINSVLDCDYGH